MALIPQNPLHQVSRARTIAQQGLVVIEFQGKHVHSADRLDCRILPASQIREVADGEAFLALVGIAVYAKAESGIAVMAKRDGANAKSPLDLQRIRLVKNELAFPVQLDHRFTTRREVVKMGWVTNQRKLPRGGLLHGAFAPMVGVSVSQQDGMDMLPARADFGESSR